MPELLYFILAVVAAIVGWGLVRKIPSFVTLLLTIGSAIVGLTALFTVFGIPTGFFGTFATYPPITAIFGGYLAGAIVGYFMPAPKGAALHA